MTRFSMLSLSMVALACSPAPRSDLLDLTSVGPERLDEGTSLVVEGAGFPVGREGTLRLVGAFHRPAAGPVAIRRSLTVRSTAEGRAERMVDAELLESLGGRGTFEGRAELSFEAARGGTVRGALDVILDLGEPSTPSRRARDTDASALLERVGMTLSDDSDALVIESIEPEGAAASAGLIVGDRIVALGGLRLRSESELRPAAGAPLELRVEREGLGGERTIFIGSAPGPSSPDPLFPALLAFAVLAFITLGPGARLFGALRRPRFRAILRDVSLTALVAAAFAVARLEAALGLAAFVVVALAAQLARGGALAPAASRLVPLGLALVVTTLARGEITLASGFDLSLGEALLVRQPLTTLPFVAALLAFASSPSGDFHQTSSLGLHRPRAVGASSLQREGPLDGGARFGSRPDAAVHGVLARALPPLARAIGATWVAVVFGLPVVAAPLLACLALSAPHASTARLVPFSILAAALSAYFLFELDTSRPVESLLDPRATLWLALGAGALLTVATRLRATPRAHLYL